MMNPAKTSVPNAEISNLKNRIVELETLVKFYEEQFLLSKKRQFGASSEKSEYDQIRVDAANESNDAEIIPSVKEPNIELIKTHYRKKRSRADSLPKDIPVEEILCELDARERLCPDCGEEMNLIGHDYRQELVVVPAKVKIRKYAACTYACRDCGESLDHTPIIKASIPKPVIKGSFASPEAIAYAAHQKFTMGVPLYRQEQEWKRQGVYLSRQTMANWLIQSAQTWLLPLINEMKRRLLLKKVLHADETTFQVLKEPGKKPQSLSYLWCYRTGGDASAVPASREPAGPPDFFPVYDEPIVLAEYKPDRKTYNPSDFLEGFSGYLHTDGYEAYHKLPPKIVVVGCWAHVRRKWDEALKIVRPEDRAGCNAMIGKRYCDNLFNMERKFASLDAEQRHAKRIEHLKPLMDTFFTWAADVNARPKSALGAAISYMFSQQQYLRNVLLDGRLELSNNRAERTIKPFVISRKNFLFANTPRGAIAAAAFFSLIETAKETGINPFEYLSYVFKTAPGINMNEPENLQALLPIGYKKIYFP